MAIEIKQLIITSSVSEEDQLSVTKNDFLIVKENILNECHRLIEAAIRNKGQR